VRLLVIGLGALLWVRFQGDWPFQKRNLISFQVGAVTGLGLLIWWVFFSRAPRRWRLLGHAHLNTTSTDLHERQ
jgi:hypothetical protein